MDHGIYETKCLGCGQVHCICDIHKAAKEINDRKQMITFVALKALCDRYDEEHGSYPEHEYEGESVYSFIMGHVDQ